MRVTTLQSKFQYKPRRERLRDPRPDDTKQTAKRTQVFPDLRNYVPSPRACNVFSSGGGMDYDDDNQKREEFAYIPHGEPVKRYKILSLK